MPSPAKLEHGKRNTAHNAVRPVPIPIPPPPSPNQSERDRTDRVRTAGGRAKLRTFPIIARETFTRMSVIHAFSGATSTNGPAQPQSAPTEQGTNFIHYIPFAFKFEVVPDPTEVKKTWTQQGATRLYWFHVMNILANAVFLALSLFATFFLPDIYAKQLLRALFLDSNYVNIFEFDIAHFLTIFVAVILLCYPSRFSWGRFNKIRWMLILIPNIVLVVAVLDHLYSIANLGDVGNQLREYMTEGLDVTQKTTLSHSTQLFFKCCGLEGYKDWDPVLKTNGSIYFGGYPPTCCSDRYIKSCSYPIGAVILMEPAGTPFHQMWPDGCYSYELALLQATAILVWIIIAIMTSTTTAATVYLWWVIRRVNIYDVTIEHPFYK